MADNQNPRPEEKRPESVHSPPADRGRRSWKMSVTIGYGIAFLAVLTYAMARDKDVLLAFLAGAFLSLILVLVVWHPEHIKSLRIRVRLYRVGLMTNLDTRRTNHTQEADAQKGTQKSAGSDPDEILARSEKIAAGKDEQKSKRKNNNSAVKKGQKRKTQ